MGSVQNNGWLLDYNLIDEAGELYWAPQVLSDKPDPCEGVGLDCSCKDENSHKKVCSRKRVRESCTGPGSKACREKMRRDRLNDRFLELCSILDPGRPPKNDKVAILSDAARVLNQLRIEAQKLKDTNKELQDSIRNLKAEKMELRDEKADLKAEKERMEKAVKGISNAPAVMPHHAAAFHSAAAAAAFASNSKTIPNSNYPPMAMWQWMSPASLDTSQDHVLRPPVA